MSMQNTPTEENTKSTEVFQDETFYTELCERQKARIAISYLLSFLVVEVLFALPKNAAYFFPVIGALFTLFVLWPRGKDEMGSERLRPRETWFWLAALWVYILTNMFSRMDLPFGCGRIWETSLLPALVFAPFFAGYFALLAGGKAVQNRSGSWLLLDVLHTFVSLPLGGLFERVHLLNNMRLNRSFRHGEKRFGATLAVLIAAFLLFIIAVALLRSADESFKALLEKIQSLRKTNFSFGRFLLKLLLSVPLGAYLFAQINGIDKMKSAQIEAKQERTRAFLSNLRRVRAGLWCALLGCFAALYLLFAGVQIRELAGALRTNWAPGTLTMASFAKQGFFEMCAVMALNFVLLFMAEKSTERSLREKSAGRAMLTLIVLCSLLFASSAILKLYMYLRSFGFTALRVQGAWGITVLVIGCLCTLVWIWKKRDCTRTWLLSSALLLTATFLY